MLDEQDNLRDQRSLIDAINEFRKDHDLDIPKLDTAGICSALTTFFLYTNEAILRNILEHIYKITTLSDVTDADITHIKNFVEAVTQLQSIHKYYPDIQQQNIDKALGKIADNQFVQDLEVQALQCKGSISYIFNKEELKNFLQQLAEIKSDNLIIYLGTLSHAMGLQREKGLYYFYNPDEGTAEALCKGTASLDDIVNDLFKTIIGENTYSSDTYAGLSFDVFSHQQELYELNLLTILQRVVKLDIEQVSRVDVEDNNLFHLTSYNGHQALFDIMLNTLKNSDTLNQSITTIIDAKNKDGETPLFLAAGRGYQNIVEDLIKNNADINVIKDDKNILMKAASSGNTGLVEYLLGQLNNKEIALNQIKDAEKTIFTYAITRKHFDMVSVLLGQSNLLSTEVIELLLLDIVRFGTLDLLEKVFNEIEITQYIDKHYGEGLTLLQYAIQENRPIEFVIKLLGLGADPTIGNKENQLNTLHYAVIYENNAIVRLLLDKNSALLKSTDAEKQTALDHAQQLNNDSIIKLIQDYLNKNTEKQPTQTSTYYQPNQNNPTFFSRKRKQPSGPSALEENEDDANQDQTKIPKMSHSNQYNND